MRKFTCLVILSLFPLFLFSLITSSIVKAEPIQTRFTGQMSPGSFGSVGTPSQPGLPAHIESREQYDQGNLNLGGTVSNQLSDTFYSGTCLMLGCPSLVKGDSTSKQQTGVVGILASSIGTMITNPPASGGRYTEYLASSIKIPGAPTPAYAQTPSVGIGYTGLNPILEVWKFSRNVAYVIFTIIFVAIGFMIIFRVKIDPKTVISVQSALPKIIIALLVITFSYPIVGFMIDIMYYLIGLLINIFATVLGGSDSQTIKTLKESLTRDTIFGAVGAQSFWQVTTGASGAIGNIVNQIVITSPSDVLSGVIGKILGGAANALAWFVFSAALLIALFRTWFSLLGAYVNIILGVISAPLFLIFEAIPGRGTLGIWLRQMLANILVFPFVVLMLLVGYALTSSFGAVNPSDPAGNNFGFVPPLIGGNDIGAIKALIGFGIILTIPRALAILQEVLKAPSFKYGSAWQEPLQPIVKFGQGVGGAGVHAGRGFAAEEAERRIFGGAPGRFGRNILDIIQGPKRR